MSGPTVGPTAVPTRASGRIVFDLLLVVFAAVIVVSSIGLRGGAGTVPLIVGVPTLVGTLYVLVRDLLGRRSGSAAPADAADAPPALEAPIAVPASVLDSLGAGLAALPSDEEAETPESRRRQYLFAAWTVGFVILAALTSFYIAVPVAMLVLFVTVRLSPVAIVATIAGVLGLLYGLFDLFLRVRL